MDSKSLNKANKNAKPNPLDEVINVAELKKEYADIKEKPAYADPDDVTFVDYVDEELLFDSKKQYFAVDRKGRIFPNEESIENALKKKGVSLFVFDGSGLPYEYRNENGKIKRSDEPIGSMHQYQESEFDPRVSPLPEDIVKGQANAYKYNESNDLFSDAKKLIEGNEKNKKREQDRYKSLTDQIKALEKKHDKIKQLPVKEPVLEGGVVEPTKPKPPVAPVEPVAPVPPKKPEIEESEFKIPERPAEPVAPDPPREPLKPVEPKKPEVLLDEETLKNIDFMDYPERKVQEPKVPVHPGEAPSYSRIVQFLSKLFLGRDSKAYSNRLLYNSKLNAYESDLADYRDKKKEFDEAEVEYQKEVSAYEKNSKLLVQKNQTLSYKAALERYTAEMRRYSVYYKEYEDALKEYKKAYRNYEEEMVKYKEDLKNYEEKMNSSERNTEREISRLEANKYADAMTKYDDAATKYDIEYEKYKVEKEQFPEKLAQYEKDANAYEKASKQYEADLEKYNQALDKYPGGKEGYEKDQKAFMDALKKADLTLSEYHNVPDRIEKGKNRVEMLKRTSRANKLKVERARKNIDKLRNNFVKNATGYSDNLEEIEEYRSHIEVKLEGIADLLENNKITRKNLFATTWMLRGDCSNKSFNDPDAVEKLTQYVACKQAEKDILDKTSSYKIANPEAEENIIRNLNNGQTVQRMKNDPMFKAVLESQKGKPINPDEIAKAYMNPSKEMKAEIQLSVAKNSMNVMIQEMEDSFGSKPLDEKCFADYVRWKTYKNMLADEKNLVDYIKDARTDFYSTKGAFTGKGELSDLYSDTIKEYKETFIEVLKNQRNKEKETNDLPESIKRLMRLKVNYNLKELDEAVSRVKENKAEAGKNNEGQAKNNEAPAKQVKQPVAGKR